MNTEEPPLVDDSHDVEIDELLEGIDFCDEADEGVEGNPEIGGDGSGEGSDVCSDMLEDLEGSSDDNILIEKEVERVELLNKLKKMKANSRKKRDEEVKQASQSGVEERWYSDPGEDEELVSLDGSNDEACRYHYYNKDEIDMRSYELKVGDKFANCKVFREVLRDWCVRHGYSITWVKNENSRITAACKQVVCNWRIHASRIGEGPVFQIKTLNGSHNCARSFQNRLANYKYLACRMEKTLKDNPDIRIEKLQQKIYRKLSLNVNYWTVLKVKKHALDLIRGEDGKEYEMLWDYCETVRYYNPGSKILLRKQDGVEPPTFDRMYYCLDGMMRGFLDGCRPIIGLDGCFLKTCYGGQLLAAIGRDGNDNMWPIAMAVVRVENRDTWAWFLNELFDDIGGVEGGKWTFVSDRQKGLIDALEQLAPECEHRFCLRRLYANFKQKYSNPELKSVFWQAACTGNVNEFEMFMRKMEHLDPKFEVNYESASEWLRNIPLKHWARSHFTSRCNSEILVNNLCESFNNYILQARDKPIISMFEWIRCRLATRIQTKKVGIENYGGNICPNIVKKLEKIHKKSKLCVPRYYGGNEFEVEHATFDGCGRYVVYLDKKTCTCGLFQMAGLPCCHAYAAICERRESIDAYVNDCFKKEIYVRVYSHMIHAVPGSRDYIKTTFQPLRPPISVKKRGRPKKMRKKAADEIQVSTRKGVKKHCQRCLQVGHNTRSCKNPVNPRSKFYQIVQQSEMNMGTQASIVHESQASSSVGSQIQGADQSMAMAMVNNSETYGHLKKKTKRFLPKN